MKFDPRLYLVLDPSQRRPVRQLEEFLEQAIDGGVTLVQVREKGCSNAEFLNLATTASRVLKARGIPLIVNDRADVAVKVQADGLHIGQNDLHWSRARQLLGPGAILGLSVENLMQARDAEPAHVDYLGVSAVFPTSTKKDVAETWGLAGLKELRRVSRHVLVGIGGIDASNALNTLQNGADGLAVVSAICSSHNPKSEARRLRTLIDNHLARERLA